MHLIINAIMSLLETRHTIFFYILRIYFNTQFWFNGPNTINVSYSSKFKSTESVFKVNASIQKIKYRRLISP